jgi:Tectonin domain
MKNQTAKSLASILTLVLAIGCAQSALAQSFKQAFVKDGAGLVQVAAGGASVWALDVDGHPYIFQNNLFVLANAVSLSQIAIGGGNDFQADAIWGLDSSGKIYSATKSGSSWLFSQTAGVLNSIAVGPGYNDHCHPYEVWGINPNTLIFRYDFCSGSFNQVAGTLDGLAVGGGDIWGINGNHEIFRFNFATGSFDKLPGILAQISVGPSSVWGINTDSLIYEFYDNTQRFSQLQGSLNQIQAGGDGVWGLNSSNLIFRLDPNTSTFVQIPGTLDQISVGTGTGVWGINSSSNQAFAFSTP